MSVSQAQGVINAREFAEWMAYDSLDPIGSTRSDLRAGIIASTIANVNRGKNGQSFKPDDFMPQFDKPKQSAQSIASTMMQFARAHNNQLERK